MSDRALSERIRDLIGWFDPEFSPQAQVVNGLANEVRDLESPTPQIVRTIADLEALDPDTLVAISAEHGDCDQPRLAGWVRTFFPLSESGPVFPAVVVASGEHVRACRAALEGETK